MNGFSDLELLKRFAPVLRFTRGEQFFPARVEDYISECSLWVQHPQKQPQMLVPEGRLTLEELARQKTYGFNSVYYLQFIEPLNITELATYFFQRSLKKQDAGNIFRTGRGRLSRVGYTSRFIGALFSLSLLTRGRVKGDKSAAAAITYQQMRERNPEHIYYGRVIQQSGWVILQYWYFYVFNNWRSGYFGVNDHEADWEMVNIYLYETPDGDVQPEWVAYANHDFSGDDLRRHWDDPEVEKNGEHPFIYCGAGSHASFYSAGEYLSEFEVPFLSPFVRLVDRIKLLWKNLLRQTIGEEAGNKNNSGFNVFRVPFVDYARGDGLSIGEGQSAQWGEPVLLNPEPDWILNYRGLWGYYARDPVSGEDAPAGVRYNRNGSVRKVWYDPLGWAGLDKVPPPVQLRSLVLERKFEIESRLAIISQEVEKKQHQLYDLGVELNAIRGKSHMLAIFKEHEEEIQKLSSNLDELRLQLSEGETMLESLDRYEADLRTGRREPLRDHIQHSQVPEKEADLRLGWIAEIWSALSIGLMLMGFIILAIFGREKLLNGLVAILMLVIFIEAGFRRRLSQLISGLTIALAILSALVLLYEFFWFFVIIFVTIAGIYMIWENLSELWK